MNDMSTYQDDATLIPRQDQAVTVGDLLLVLSKVDPRMEIDVIVDEPTIDWTQGGVVTSLSSHKGPLTTVALNTYGGAVNLSWDCPVRPGEKVK